MVDTQRFAIWHPPAGMPDAPTAKKPALISAPQQPPTRFSKNIGQILNQYHWKEDAAPLSTSPPKISPTNQAPPSWSYSKPAVTPPQPQPTQSRYSARVEDADDSEGEESSSSSEEEEEVIAAAPVWQKSTKPLSPPALPIIETRERLQFSKPKESARAPETKPAPFNAPSTSFKVSTGLEEAKATYMTKKMTTTAIPPKLAPDAKPKLDRTDSVATPIATQPKINGGWRPRSNSTAPPSMTKPPAPKVEQPRKVNPPAAAPIAQKAPPAPPPRRASHDPDLGYLAYNSVVTLNAFLTELQDTAFDGFKMSMMEASIRQFHLIAADADVQLTRELIAMKAQTNSETRSSLIEKHRILLEEQALNVLDGMHDFHSHVREQCWKATHELERPREEPLVESIPREALSDSRPVVSERVALENIIPEKSLERVPEKVAQKAQERVPEKILDRSPERAPERVAEKTIPEKLQEKAPEFWKPTFFDDSTPPTPKLAIDEVFERVQADLERDERFRTSLAAPPAPAKAKVNFNQTTRPRAPTISNQSTSMQTKSEPTLIKPPTKPTETAIDTPSQNPTEKPGQNPTLTKPAVTATKQTPAKPKTAKELRAEKKKGKTKVTEEGQQQASDSLETMIDNMVSTGNVESALEQMSGAWR